MSKEPEVRYEYVGFWGFVTKYCEKGEGERIAVFVLFAIFLIGMVLSVSIGGCQISGAYLESNREASETERLRLLSENPEIREEQRAERIEKIKELRAALENADLSSHGQHAIIDAINKLAEE